MIEEFRGAGQGTPKYAALAHWLLWVKALEK